MAWGGSLNKDGTKYYRILRSADNAVAFLEELKQFLSKDKQEVLNNAIEIVTDHINSLTDSKILDPQDSESSNNKIL